VRISEKRIRWPLTAAAILSLIFFGPGQCTKRFGKGKSERAKMDIAELAGALDLFRFDDGRFPSTEEGLGALVRNPGLEKWGGPYLRKGVPSDPWGGDYHYRGPRRANDPGFEIWSWGADGVPGGTGEAADVTYQKP